MWKVIFFISVLLMFVAPPFLFLAAFAMWMDMRNQEKTERLRSESPPISNSHPGPCPACGAQQWHRSRLRVMPAMGIRSFQFPMEGNVAVAAFTCTACGAFGRYGRSYAQPERGWILLDRYMGGW